MSTRLKRPISVSELAYGLGLVIEGTDFELSSVAPLSAARVGALTFMSRAATLTLPRNVAVISGERPECSVWIRTETPRLDFVKALRWLDQNIGFDRPTGAAQIHPSVRMGSGTSIGRGVVIGEGTVLEDNIRIADGVLIGKDCRIKSGSVIGEDGFGFERDTDGTPLRMLHLGGVILGDRVEVGSLNTVCQGTLSPTRLEDDVKMDDHVHVAHNCLIKKKALLTACVELSGGVIVGEGAWIGPNASVIDGATIGDQAFIGIGAVVIRDVLPRTTVVGNPARELTRKP
jgi:UDP-3-O-[3-hydroxymyristoyl] glucosamine N-acyltransferase